MRSIGPKDVNQVTDLEDLLKIDANTYCSNTTLSFITLHIMLLVQECIFSSLESHAFLKLLWNIVKSKLSLPLNINNLKTFLYNTGVDFLPKSHLSKE